MKRFICVLLVLTVLSLAGCTSLGYEDTNGEDDYSLQTLTEEDIVYSTNHTRVMSSTMTVNSKTVCKARSMSGVVELFEKKTQNETLEIVVSCEITKGNARLVLVANEEIVHDFALNEDNQCFTLENVTGEVSLRLAGESTGYSITYVVSKRSTDADQL